MLFQIQQNSGEKKDNSDVPTHTHTQAFSSNLKIYNEANGVRDGFLCVCT